MIRALRSAALGAGLAFLLSAPALAEPSGACVWNSINPADQGAVATVVMQGGDMPADLADRVQLAVRGCGFEATANGDYRASFLLGLYVHRLATERTLMATGRVTAANLDETWRTLDPAWKNSLRAFVISRYNHRDVPLPDAGRLSNLANAMHLQGDGVSALRSYLLLRATIDYVEAEGSRFHPAPEEAAPPAS